MSARAPIETTSRRMTISQAWLQLEINGLGAGAFPSRRFPSHRRAGPSDGEGVREERKADDAGGGPCLGGSERPDGPDPNNVEPELSGRQQHERPKPQRAKAQEQGSDPPPLDAKREAGDQ